MADLLAVVNGIVEIVQLNTLEVILMLVTPHCDILAGDNEEVCCGSTYDTAQSSHIC